MELKGMNNTMEPDGLVPTLLVCGPLPTLHTTASDLPPQLVRGMRALERARMAVLRTAREEMDTSGKHPLQKSAEPQVRLSCGSENFSRIFIQTPTHDKGTP